MSRKVVYQDKRLTMVTGIDHMLGKFIQLYDNEVETSEGEGLVLDWSQGFKFERNFTGIPTNGTTAEKICDEYIKTNQKI